MAKELSEVAKKYVHFMKNRQLDLDGSIFAYLILRTDEKLSKFMTWLEENPEVEEPDIWEYIDYLDGISK